MGKKSNRKKAAKSELESKYIGNNYDSSSLDALNNITQASNDDSTAYVSDTSDTVDASENENLTDEPFTYLQNLNSDNLMKFSQQSDIMHLMDQMVEPKMNVDCIPVAEEHDRGGYDFGIQVICGESSRAAFFSKESKRLYIKSHENVTIDCSFKVKMPIQPLNVRVLPIYTKDTSEPVLRCANHVSKDTEPNVIIRNSIIRCENLGAVYNGSDTGKSIRDRYSILVPLNAAVKSQESNSHLKQPLIISFTCNNSCNARKQTSVLFLLENLNGDILAQRQLCVKISTCPKRDHRLYEKSVCYKRRNITDPDFNKHESKVPRYDDASIKEECSRSSYGEQSDDEASGVANGEYDDSADVCIDPESNEYVLTLRYRTRRQLLDVIRTLYSNAVSNEVFFKTTVHGRRTRDSVMFKKLYEKSSRLD
ncbi:p53 isoform X2 [Haematobia irritans]|uniref:p53 isoform X2 n=1 Tax=Haematobia irritans TaxID=7368 RepID=UPI003F4F4245